MALHQHIRGYKIGSDLSWIVQQLRPSFFFFLFSFVYSVRSLCPDVHIKVRRIMLKARSHENVHGGHCCT